MAEVLHHDKLKNRSDIAAIDRHNRRLSSGKQEGNQFAKPFSRANVDPNLTKYNQQLVPFPHASLLEAVDAAIKERVTGVVRRTSVKIISYIVSAENEFFMPGENSELDASGRWDKKRLEEWTTASMEFLKTTYGAENVLSATLHLDEKTPHIHVAIIPITPDGRLSAFDWLGSPKKCRDIQTEYDRAVGHLGLKRGLKGSVARHQTTRRFYAELEKKLEGIPEPPPPLPEEKGFPGSEKRKKYNEISEQREQFAQQILKLVDKTGGALFTKATEYDAMKAELEESQKKAAYYKEQYEAVKSELNMKTLRALDIATVAKLCGYTYYKEDGHFFGNLQKIKIDEGFEFTDYNGQKTRGKNAIDFMKIHLEITENRHITPAEAIVRLAGVADDPRRVSDTIRQIALDEAEAQLAPLRPQFAGAVEAERQRQEERKKREKREAAEAAARLAELEAAAEARQQPGQPEPEPEPEPTPPPQLETPPPPPPAPEPEPEPEPEEPEPGMSM